MCGDMQDDYEGPARLELKRYLTSVWARRRQIGLFVLAAATAAAAASLSIESAFTSRTTIFLPTPIDGVPTTQLADPRPPLELIRDPDLLSQVADETELSLAEVKENLEVVATEEGPLTVEFSAREATLAEKGAEAVGQVFAERQEELQQQAFERSLDGLTIRGASLQGQVSQVGRRLTRAQRRRDVNLARTLEATRDALILQIVANEQAVAELEVASASLQPPFVEPATNASSSGRGLVRNSALAGTAALLLGIIAALVAERLAGRVSGRSELERLSGVPVTASLPLVNRGETNFDARGRLDEPFRAIRARLDALGAERDGFTLLVASPLEGDGRTTCVARLGASFAATARRCLVVSSDLRAPKLDAGMGGSAGAGVCDVLRGTTSLDQAVQSTGLHNLFLLPLGGRNDDPEELLMTGPLQKIVREISTTYDVAILDSPPILSYADATLLAPLVDKILVVVDVTDTSRAEIDRAIDELRGVGGDVGAVVPNKVGAIGSTFLDLEI